MLKAQPMASNSRRTAGPLSTFAATETCIAQIATARRGGARFGTAAAAFPVDAAAGKRLRFSMPAALCSYCLGETRIGESYQMGNVRKMELEMPTGLKNDGAPGAPEAPGGSE